MQLVILLWNFQPPIINQKHCIVDGLKPVKSNGCITSEFIRQARSLSPSISHWYEKKHLIQFVEFVGVWKNYAMLCQPSGTRYQVTGPSLRYYRYTTRTNYLNMFSTETFSTISTIRLSFTSLILLHTNITKYRSCALS